MLESITVENFQCHQDSVIELDQDSNVVVVSGSSDNGKSSIFRSIGLVLNNRPSGYGYKPHTAKKKDITNVNLKFSNGVVKRSKSASIDEYMIEADDYSKEPFTALSRQVPEEVKTFLNLNESNFQSQHEPHFFISKTPGERAKLLNEVSGLEIIDKSITNINSLIKANTGSLEKTKDEIKDLNNKKEKLEFVKDADVLLTSIEEKLKEIDNLTLRNQRLQNYCLEIEKTETKIKKLKEFLKVKDYVFSISGLIKDYEQVKNRNTILSQYVGKILTLNTVIDEKTNFLKIRDYSNQLKTSVNQYNELKSRNEKVKKFRIELENINETIASITEWLKVKMNYNILTACQKEIMDLQIRQTNLQNYIKRISKFDLNIINSIVKLNELKNKKKMYIDQFGICPFCGKSK